MKPSEITDYLRRRYQSISAFAEEKAVAREMVYQAAAGRGSRALRLLIAGELKKQPSEVWPSQSRSRRLDDEEYFQQIGQRAVDEQIQSPWLNFDEAVAYLRYRKPKTLRNLVARKAVPFIKEPESGALRFHKPTLDAWLRKGAV